MNHSRIAYPKDEVDDEDDLFLAAEKKEAAESKVAETDDSKSGAADTPAV